MLMLNIKGARATEGIVKEALLVELDGNLCGILQERFAERGLDASFMDSLWEVTVYIHSFVTYASNVVAVNISLM